MLARALQDCGTRVVAHVPGFGASDVFRHFEQPHSYNEEPAYGMAHGAALAGARSAVLFKGHGMLKAANALSASLSCGVTAALVCLVFDDPDGTHSDNILDTEAVLMGLDFPVRRGERGSLYHDVVAAVRWSEERGLPVALLVDSGWARLPEPPLAP
ncbi:MAG: hypothetical protein AB1758_36920, partial [Candidatus Eremiobacterota bacterium]